MVVIRPPAFLTGCPLATPNKHIWAYWVPMLAFESTLFMLAVVKAFEVARQEVNTSKILAVLLRDSVIYFGGIVAIILTNLVISSAVRVRCTAHAILSILTYWP